MGENSLTYDEWLKEAGISSVRDEHGAGSHYEGVGEGANGMYRTEGQSDDSYLHGVYDKAMQPGYGVAGRSYKDMQQPSAGSFFSPIGQLETRNGQQYARVGEDLSASMKDPKMAEVINKFGGPGIAINDPEKGWMVPQAMMPYLGQINAKNNSSWADMLPALFGAAVTGGVGALGAAAPAVAGGAGWGAGGMSAGQLGMGITNLAGSAMTGGSPWSSLAGMGVNAAGGSDFLQNMGGNTPAWGVNAREAGTMSNSIWDDIYSMYNGGENSSLDNWSSQFGDVNNYNPADINLSDQNYQNQDNESGSRDPGTETNGMQPGFLQNLAKLIFGGGAAGRGLLGGGSGGGSQGGIFSNLIPGLLERGNMQDFQKFLMEGYQKAADAADPFKSQRPAYQNELLRSYNDPNFFNGGSAGATPIFKGLQDESQRRVQAQMAAGGYNQSGNMLQELGKSSMETGMKYALPFQQQLSQNAGANFGPGFAGTILGQGTQAAGQAGLQANGGTGYAAQPFLDALFGPSTRTQNNNSVNNFIQSLGQLTSGSNTSSSNNNGGQTPNVVNGGSGGGPNLLGNLFGL